MYSQKVIQKTLDDFARRNGWMPEPHTVPEIAEFNEQIGKMMVVSSNSVNKYYDWNPNHMPTESDKRYIRRWVENEQFMVFADAEYFKTRYCYILGVGDEIIRYVPREVQQLFHRILAEFDDQQVAIELFLLKCRQLGVSTEVALDFMHRILTRSNTKAVMASVKQKQSDLLLRMIDTVWTRLPFWLPPGKKVIKTTAPEWANGSALSMQSGSQTVGIAQGWTPNCVHISEIADFTNPKKTMDEGLFRAVSSHRSTFFAIEGTGSGDTGWQAEKWDFYKKNWGRGGRFRPLFFPPALASDMYPLPDWIRKNPVPIGWQPLPETERMRKRAELFIRSTDYLTKQLGSTWSMKKEYAWWWEVNYLEAVASHTEKVFLAQMACTDREALQGVHDKAFNDGTIEIVSNEREKGYAAYAITGKSILIGSESKPYEPDPREIDHRASRIRLFHIGPDDHRYDWELVPLLPFDDRDDRNCFDKLLVYYPPPEVPVDVSVGVDTAGGLGHPNEDRGSITATINRFGLERDEQAATFTSLRVNSAQMTAIAACVATLFKNTIHPLGPKFAIEQIRKPGDTCQVQLKLMGFYHHHRMVRYDGTGLPDPSLAHREGWFTQPYTRSILLDTFLAAVKTGWFKLNSPILIRQMKAFERVEKAGQAVMTHPSGGHDDEIFSAAMSYITRHDLDNNPRRHEQRYRAREERLIEIDYRWASQEVRL